MKSAALPVSLNLGKTLKYLLKLGSERKRVELSKTPSLSLPVLYRHRDGDTITAVSPPLNAFANSPSRESCPKICALPVALIPAPKWSNLPHPGVSKPSPSRRWLNLPLPLPSGRTGLTPSPGTHLERPPVRTEI